MNFILVASLFLAPHINSGGKTYTAREVFDKCISRAAENDSVLTGRDLQFTQNMIFESRSGDKNTFVFKVTIRHGAFERELVSSDVANGDRFNGGYEAFDKMFLLSQYFSKGDKVLSSCELDKPVCNECYGLNFSFSKSSDSDDPLSTVYASVNAYTYAPQHIEEKLTGLPLGVEFRDIVDVSYDSKLGVYFPENIVMHVYARFLFLKGQIALITIKNGDLRQL
ncbi:MAG TPA: hypothetical protein VIS48_07080 [Candidatus Kryptonia bacterium]